MSFAEIQKLKELLKTLQGSGEATTRIRMEVGRAIKKIQTERSAARTAPDVNIEQPLSLFESSFDSSFKDVKFSLSIDCIPVSLTKD